MFAIGVRLACGERVGGLDQLAVKLSLVARFDPELVHFCLRSGRHCEERSDEAIQQPRRRLDCFACGSQ
jgi:hypothetical protein